MGQKSLTESAAEVLAASAANAGKEPIPMAALSQTGVDLGGEIATGIVTAVGSASAQTITPASKPGLPGVPAEPMKTLSPMSGEGEESAEEESEESEENVDEKMAKALKEASAAMSAAATLDTDAIMEGLIAEHGDQAVFNYLMESAVEEYGAEPVYESFATTLVEEFGEDKVIELFVESVATEFSEQEISDEEFATLQEQSAAFENEVNALSEEDFDNYIASLNEEDLIYAIQLSTLNEGLFKKIVKGVKKIGKGALKVAGKVLSNPIGSALLSVAMPGVGGVLGGLASKAVGKLAATGLGKLASAGVSKLASSALGQGVKKIASTAVGGAIKSAIGSGVKNAALSKISGGSASQGFKSGLIGGLAGSAGGALGGKVAQLTGSNLAGDIVGNVAATKLSGGGSQDVKNAALSSISGGLGTLSQALQARRDAKNAAAADTVASAGEDEGEEITPKQAPVVARNNVPARNRLRGAAMVAEETTNDIGVLLEGVVNSLEEDTLQNINEETFNQIIEQSETFAYELDNFSDEEIDNYFESLSEEQFVYAISLLTIAEQAETLGFGDAAAAAVAKRAIGKPVVSRLLGRAASRFVPGASTVLGAKFAKDAWDQGDYVGAGLNALAAIPGTGMLAAAPAIAWETHKAAKEAGGYGNLGRNVAGAAKEAGGAIRDIGGALGTKEGRGALAQFATQGAKETFADEKKKWGQRAQNVAANVLSAVGGKQAVAATPKPTQRPAAMQQQKAAVPAKPQVSAAKQGAVGSQLASTSGGMFASKSDRLNQSKVDAVLGKGKFKAGSAEANLALAKHFKSQPKATVTESVSGESVMEEQNYEQLLEQTAVEFIDHLSTLSEEEMNSVIDQLSDEQAAYIDYVLNEGRGRAAVQGGLRFLGRLRSVAQGASKAGKAAAGAGRAAAGAGKGAAAAGKAARGAKAAGGLKVSKGALAAGGLAAGAAGYGVGAMTRGGAAEPAAPAQPARPSAGGQAAPAGPAAAAEKSEKGDGVDYLRDKINITPQGVTSGEAPETPAAQDQDDHGKEMLDQLQKDIESIPATQQTAPVQAGVGLMRDKEGKKTKLRKAIPNELAGVANAFGNLFKVKELGWKPGTDRSGKPVQPVAMEESLNNFKSLFNALTEQETDVEDTMEQLTDEQIQEAKMQSIKDKVSQYKGNMREDVDALFNGESLSEEFRVKATLIFESAVTSRVESILEQVMADNEEVLANAYEEIKSELTEQVDEYLNYVVDQWMDDNKVAIETGLRSELAEDFISGLRALFQEHYIEIPEEKVDVAETLANELAQTQEYVEAQNAAIEELQEELNLVKKEKAINDICEGLTAVQAGKMKSLAESVEFTAEGDFAEKLAVLRENYFPSKVQVKSEVKDLQQVALNEEPEVENVNGVMARYVEALSKTAPKA